MSERAVVFDCEGEELLGILHLPAIEITEQPTTAVMIIVGGPQYRVGSHRQFVLTARFLATAGYPVFRFDYRGMGDSSGPVRTFEQAGDDIGAALAALFQELPSLRSVCVFGLCDAASAALLFCSSDPRVDSLVLANPWVRTDVGQAKAMVKHYYAQRLFQKSFWLKLLSGGMNPLAAVSGLFHFWRRSQSVGMVEEGFIARMLKGLLAFRGPVLLLMSERDLTAREFDELCRSDGHWRAAMQADRVTRLSLAEADHTFSDEKSLAFANEAIRAFLGSPARQK
jgi:uncharacterized protein